MKTTINHLKVAKVVQKNETCQFEHKILKQGPMMRPRISTVQL